jgi:hypothetical protein
MGYIIVTISNEELHCNFQKINYMQASIRNKERMGVKITTKTSTATLAHSFNSRSYRKH